MSARKESSLDIKEKKSILNIILVLSGIIISGIVIRIYYLPYEIPLTLDALLYFWYANDIAISNSLPKDYSPANNGWPIFLSFFFKLYNSTNFMDYMLLQRIISIILSSLTAIPIYFLAKKYFSKELSLIGSTLFVFEPRIIQNSIGGIAEPIFILLITSSIVCFLNKQKKIIIFGFMLISLASIIRSEGIILLIPFTILYGIRFRKSKRTFYEIPILILVFILIILPISTYRIDVNGEDSLLSRIPNIFEQENQIEQNLILDNSDNLQNSQKSNNIKNIFLTAGWSSIPFFIVLIPFGVYHVIRYKKSEMGSLVSILFFLSIPATYAISLFEDGRYLLVLYPILCVISLFSIKKYFNKFLQKNIKLIILISLILVGSITFLEIKKVDINHEYESIKIAKIVSEKTEIINQYTMESGYLPIIGIQELKEFPVLKSEFEQLGNDLKHCYNIHDCKNIIPIKSNGIIEFIKNAKEKNITHLVIDDKEKRRVSFINEIFKNEEEFPFLKKIYDSKENGFSYHVKIFEIDFQQFNKLK